MNKFDVGMALAKIGEARSEWGRAQTEFTKAVETSMKRLLHEAAAARMSPQDVAKLTGMTVKRVRLLMKRYGLDPTKGKVLLSQQAAAALAENAELLGIDPHEVDLMSPLAYLPMGRQMRDALQSEAVRGVHEVEPSVGELAAVFSEAWHERDAAWRAGGTEGQSERTEAGIRAVLKALA